jgi:ubiquinone/menaquinone biosynthesis C-methylase UbiE
MSVMETTKQSEGQTGFAGANKGRDYEAYTHSLDAALEAKAASIFPHFGEVAEGAVIIDVGSGTGQLAEYAAREFRARVYAVDLSHELLEMADKNRSLIHLVFDDARTLTNIPSSSADIIYHTTIGHEIKSFSGEEGLKSTLAAAFRSLKPGGKEIWRDFVKPPEGTVFLKILTDDGVGTAKEAMVDGILDYHRLSVRARFDRFYEEFLGGRAFKYEIVRREGEEYIKLGAKFAQEFLMRKDYAVNWRNEIKEEYTYWTPEEARAAFGEAGFTDIEVFPDDNQYIRDNRLKGKVALCQEENGQLKEIDFFLTHMVVVGHKPKDESREAGVVEIPFVDYQAVLDLIVVNEKEGLLVIDGRQFAVGELVGQGAHKRAYRLKDGSDCVIKIARKDRPNIHSVFKSMQQAIERQPILEELNVPHMRIVDYDQKGPPFRYVIQEAIPKTAICAAKLIKDNALTEEDINQIAGVVNKFELGKQWQIDTSPYNWFRVKREDGRTEMVYTGGTVYRYDEAWAFSRIGLLQWIDPRYILGGVAEATAIPKALEADEFAKKWAEADSPMIGWWKKHLSPILQPRSSPITGRIKE